MSTRALIASGTRACRWRSIYVHQDGYPGTEDAPGVGLTLRDHYNTNAKVEALLAVGDMSQLADTVGQITTAYGTPECAAASMHGHLSDLQFSACSCSAQWLYLWTGAQWLCCPIDPLNEAKYKPGAAPTPMHPVKPEIPEGQPQ